jgi:hypothetical protein
MPKVASDVKVSMERMRRFLETENPKERIPARLYEDLHDVLKYLDNYFDFSGNQRARDFTEFILTSRLNESLTVGEANVVLERIDEFLRSTEVPRVYATGGLVGKIEALERQLTYLSSNPALAKKIARLEKEVRKLRVTSVTSSEGAEKKQEDMLKRYKDAEKKVFVVMPFAQIFDDVWKGGIERACNTEDFGYLRVDKISLSSWITEDIKEYVKMADFVIADITQNNPNVMFELGWALALEKKPIVIRQQDDPNKVPFDVKDIRYIPYVNSWSGIESLFKDICKFLKTTSETVDEEPTEKKTRKKRSTKK